MNINNLYMKNEKPLFVIITRNHNRYLLTCEFIESIEKIYYENKKIIIVDDGSTDNSGYEKTVWC